MLKYAWPATTPYVTLYLHRNIGNESGPCQFLAVSPLYDRIISSIYKKGFRTKERIKCQVQATRGQHVDRHMKFIWQPWNIQILAEGGKHTKSLSREWPIWRGFVSHHAICFMDFEGIISFPCFDDQRMS